MRPPEQIKADVERGRVVVHMIAQLEAELKEIEARLITDGETGHQEPLQDANREGKQFLASGLTGILPIRFESDLIAGSFSPDDQMHQAVLAAIGEEHLPKFFKDVRKFERIAKDGEAFRKAARQHLEPDAFAALVKAVTMRDKAGIAKSKTVVAWKDIRPLTEATA
jgi:hypothetical protein